MSEERTTAGGASGRDKAASGPPLRIFLNYRREDSAGYAGRLWDALVEALGRETVFMDIDTIAPGSNFVDVIDTNLRDCDVALVIIGPNWLTASEGRNRRRLRNPGDFVRLEIEGALARGIHVLPVLVGGARMPSASDLPTNLQALAYRQAFELSDRRWRDDMSALLEWLRAPVVQLARASAVASAPRQHPPPAPAPIPAAPKSPRDGGGWPPVPPPPSRIVATGDSWARDSWPMRGLVARRTLRRARLLCLATAVACTVLGLVYFLDAEHTIGLVDWPPLVKLGALPVLFVGVGGALVYMTHGAIAARLILWLATAVLLVLFAILLVQTGPSLGDLLRFRYIYEIFGAVAASAVATIASRFVEPVPSGFSSI